LGVPEGAEWCLMTTLEKSDGKVIDVVPRYLVDAMMLRIWPSRYSVSQLVTLRSRVRLFVERSMHVDIDFDWTERYGAVRL
jgi:hypothetical protein